MASGSPPAAGRPDLPGSYGMPKHKKELRPCSHAEERLAAAQNPAVSIHRRAAAMP